MKVEVERLRLATPGERTDDVTAAVHRPTRRRGPAFLLTPGAGGDLDAVGLVGLADAIAGEGHLVVRANLPYREAGGRPPRADRTVPAYRALLASARALAPRTPWVIGGKSYGGRVATMLAADGADVHGVVLYGYPLHPPGKPERLRVDHWPDVSAPCLFLQGTRDVFGGPDELRPHVDALPDGTVVFEVVGGDHSLTVTRKASPDDRSRRAEQVTASLGPVVRDWIARIAGPDRT